MSVVASGAVELPPLLTQLPRYRGDKLTGVEVHALQIQHVFENPRGFELHFFNNRFVPFQVPGVWAVTRGVAAGGYFVWDRYGDKSYMDAAEFEATYTLIEDAAP